MDMVPESAAVTGRLAPEVAGYRARGGAFILVRELERMVRMREEGAPEAGVFYSSRILETLAAEALAAIGLRPNASLFHNIETLARYDLMPRETRHFADAIRRLSNRARHVLGPIRDPEADAAAAFLEPVLGWYFMRFPHGPRFSRITRDSGSVGLCPDPVLTILVHQISGTFLDDEVLVRIAAGLTAVDPTGAPDVAALVAEMLLERASSLWSMAFRLLVASLQRHPDDLRLRQLTGLYWSRAGDPARALKWLEPLPRDDETCGILGGTYKRLWLPDRKDESCLRLAFRCYWTGWKGSRGENPYLGINAAATALWLGDRERAIRIAEEVRETIEERSRVFEDTAMAEEPLNFWDEVTLAEADLILGRIEGARARYRLAFERCPERKAAIQVAVDQARLDLQFLEPMGGADHEGFPF